MLKQTRQMALGVLAGAAMLALASGPSFAQNEQFIPMNGYWVGPYAPGGSGFFGGMIDYFQMLNDARRRHQRRQAHVGEVRDRVQQCARR